MNAKRLQLLAWSISLIAFCLAVFGWGQGNNWQILGLSTYQIFPLFGLIAFSLMWSHFIAAALRVYSKLDKSVLKQYFDITSLVVLGSILLHPGLLAWQLWRDGLGLPPGSEINYVASSMGIYIIIAMISLSVFLVYELRRVYGDKPWWKYVSFASDGAMFLILLHSLKLGSQLQFGWMRLLWQFYGVTLFVAVAYMYSEKLKLALQTKH